MPSTCKFELNNPKAIYFGGENISGRIILNTSNNKNVRYVSILFQGEGKVKWQVSSTTTNSDGSSSTHTTHYRSHEVYIDSCTNVHGDGVLPAGSHVYTFNIPLPRDCPTSFEGKFGHIRYELILKINRYYRFDNIYKKPVTIIKTIDLNLNSLFKLPLVAETYTSICCWPCSGGKIFYTLKIPFGAFAPGQKLKYALHINNQSNSDTYGYFIEFTKKVIFTARTPSHQERSTKDVLVNRAFDEKCLRLTNRIIEGEFCIPSIPPSTHRSSIIFIDYKLKVVLQVSGCSSNMELEVPIIIGTIPIRESLIPSQDEERPRPQITPTVPVENIPQIVPTAPPGEDEEMEELMGDAPPKYAELGPPTFEEATRSSSPFIDTDIDERNRIIGFKPLYPMYRK